MVPDLGREAALDATVWLCLAEPEVLGAGERSEFVTAARAALSRFERYEAPECECQSCEGRDGDGETHDDVCCGGHRFVVPVWGCPISGHNWVP